MTIDAKSEDLGHSIPLRCSSTGDLHVYSTAEFDMLAALGKIPGMTELNIRGQNPTISTTSQNIWDPGGIAQLSPRTGVQYQVRSLSTEDSSSGSGAKAVSFSFLDSDFNVVTETLLLNGTTAVLTTTTDITRYRSLIILPPPTGNNNVHAGKIILEEVISGNIIAQIDMGTNNTKNALYTVPANTTTLLYQFAASTDKQQDTKLVLNATVGPNDVAYQSTTLSLYQSALIVPFQVKSNWVEKSDINLTATTNISAFVSITMQIREFDNTIWELS